MPNVIRQALRVRGKHTAVVSEAPRHSSVPLPREFKAYLPPEVEGPQAVDGQGNAVSDREKYADRPWQYEATIQEALKDANANSAAFRAEVGISNTKQGKGEAKVEGKSDSKLGIFSGAQGDDLSDKLDTISDTPREGFAADGVYYGMTLSGKKLLTPEQRIQQVTDLYTEVSNVSDHTREHIGKYYHLSETHQTDYVPSQLSKYMAGELEDTEGFMMVRPSGHLVTQLLKSEEAKGRVIGLNGGRGSGKSATLHYAAQYAKQNGWLTLAVSGFYFPSDNLGLIKPNPEREGIFDQSRWTARWFQTVRAEEAGALKQITLKGKYENRFDLSQVKKDLVDIKILEEEEAAGTLVDDGSSPQTLYDLVTYAAAVSSEAGSLLYSFVDEVRQINELPVLVAIDDINAWDHVTNFRHPVSLKKLYPRQLALVDAFSHFAEYAPLNGVSLISATSKRTQRHLDRHLNKVDVVVPVDNYSNDELVSVLRHYHTAQFIPNLVDTQFVSRTKGLTNGIPADVYHDASFL